MAGTQSSGTTLSYPYGGLSQHLANQQARGLEPLNRGFGLGAGPGWDRFQARLAGAQGPLAGLIRDVQGYSGSIIPRAQEIGSEISARGSGAFETLQSQIQQSLAALPQFQQAGQQELGYAQRYAQDAFSPVSQQPLFQEASRNLLDSIRPGLAARGLTGGGAGEKAESDATRNLAFQFGEQQNAQQQAAIPLLGGAAQQGQQLSQAGLPLAQAGIQGVGELGQFLQAQYGIPMQATTQLLSLLQSGQPGTQSLIQSTAPVGLPSSKGLNVL